MWIFRLVKKVFFLGSTILSNFTNALDCVLMKNPMFYPFSVKINKCSGNCNNINDPSARICDADVTKDLNVKVFNLM